ncbi:hypothetical protein MSAN_00680000 [Mycena sanguinolenta]|uniref:BTB domain-containing protein n=1 Tax=Mycena sanguinolenta TaxID=230812 RepID=A0A8H7DEW3_9AGAR|nr:hypothetical protein MSAN_00680000 [Mycena sanguinolenta]
MSAEAIADPANPETFTNAPPPFDDANADIVIRTLENVDFRTHKFLLSLASPFFKEMLDIPQPVATDEQQETMTHDGIPIIFLYDDQNKTLRKRRCGILPAELLAPILDVATRYRIDWAVNTVLADPHFLETNPLLLFAHACHRGRAAEAALAAKETLRFSCQNFPFEPALKLISGYQYHALLDFHRRCARAAATIARGQNPTWIPTALFPGSHDPCSSYGDSAVNSWNSMLGFPARDVYGWPALAHSSQKWWTDYMNTVAVALESRPHSSTVSERWQVDNTLVQASSSCTTVCRYNVESFMRRFVPLFEQKIEEIIGKIVEETTFI